MYANDGIVDEVALNKALFVPLPESTLIIFTDSKD
jgi:hypothetical protein